MLKLSRASDVSESIDLTTARETLAYIHDDLKRIPALADAAEALETAIAEIENVERPLLAPHARLRAMATRFFPVRFS